MMRSFWRQCLLLWALLLVSAGAGAVQPVQWSFSTADAADGVSVVRITAHITSPWHIYDMGPYTDGPQPTTITFEPNSAVQLLGGVRAVTASTRKFDQTFGMQIGYYERTAQFEQRLRVAQGSMVQLKGHIEWMACDDQSCLPPDEKEFKVALKAPAVQRGATAASTPTASTASTASVKAASPTTSSSTHGTSPTAITDRVGEDETMEPATAREGAVASAVSTPETDRVQPPLRPVPSMPDTLSDPVSQAGAVTEQSGHNNPLGRNLIAALLWGLAALLTPCVFPMIPMTVSFFMHDGGSRRRGRWMALVYGASIVVLYTLPVAVLVLVTRLTGGQSVTVDLFNWLATHWVPNLIFFVVFMVFAASFLGAFEITLPSRLVNRSDRAADRGGLIGAFFMALTLVLVSFSCTGPIVGVVLIESLSGALWTPVLTILVFSTVFALPFALFALFPSWLQRLPRSGGWLGSVKAVLGFVELALGLKFLSVADQTYHWGLLDREIYLALWIAIFFVLGLYLLGKVRLSHEGEQRPIGVGRLVLAILTFSFVVYMLPGMWGAPLKGLSGYLPPIETQDFRPVDSSTQVGVSTIDEASTPTAKYSDFLHLPHGLKGFFDLQEALNYAQKVHKPVLIDFTGHGCVNCREMEQRVWSDPEVLSLLRDQYVIAALYSDDKKQLPESEWVTTTSGKVLKGLGRINSHLMQSRYGVGSQPWYLVVDDRGNPLMPGRGYDLDVKAYVAFLRDGVTRYQTSASLQ